MFSWADGTDFPKDFNWRSPSVQPFFTVGDMEPTRDPRLYENVAWGDTCAMEQSPLSISIIPTTKPVADS